MTNAELLKTISSLSESLRVLRSEVLRRDIDWRHLVANDLVIEAIIAYRNQHACSLKEGKEMIDSFRAMLKQ